MGGELELETKELRNPSDSDPLLDEHRLQAEPPQPHLPFSSSSMVGAGEISEEDLETGSLQCCRICLESGDDDGNFTRSVRYLVGGFY